MSERPASRRVGKPPPLVVGRGVRTLAGFVLLAGAGLVCGLLAACGSTGETAGGPPRHLFLITVDTLRADHLSLYGYPRQTSPGLDRLAAGGTTFERAFAQWPMTGSSFASVFTGRYPDTTGLTQKAALRLPEEYLTLPELMSERGFTTVAVVSNGVLSRELGWGQGFDEYLQTWDSAAVMPEEPTEYRRWIHAARVNELAVPLLERHRDAERLFAWIHYSDPHQPYLLPDGVDNPFLGDEYYTDAAEIQLTGRHARSMFIGDNRERRYYLAQYDANVLYSDRHIDRLLEHARAVGLLADALVVVTADHGESLGEHDYYGHGVKPYNAGVHVPLIFAQPDGVAAGRRVDVPVELVDLYATLQDLVAPGAATPGLEGDNLTSLLRPTPRPRQRAARRPGLAFSAAGGRAWQFRSVQDDEWKLIYRLPREDKEGAFALYHLTGDPMETLDLVAREPARVERMSRGLLGWMRRIEESPRAGEEKPEENAETLKALKALGYLD